MREWLCIGHVGEVPEPGDQLPMTIVGEPIVMLRDTSGDIRVMSSVCQHRGHPIFGGLEEEKRKAEGRALTCVSAKRMVCPYHNWQYTLDGKLVAAPSMTETVPVKQLRETIQLPQIRHEVFHGLVFINFDEDAAPLAPTVAKMDEELRTFGIATWCRWPRSSSRTSSGTGRSTTTTLLSRTTPATCTAGFTRRRRPRTPGS